MTRLIKVFILSTVICLFVASIASASTIKSDTLANELSSVHTMQFWVNDQNVDFKSIKFDKHSAKGWTWKFADDSKTSVLFTGPEAGVKDVFSSIQFTAPSSRTKFDVEWAEISKLSTITGTMSYNTFNKKNWTYSTGEISHAPTPIPGAVLIFGCGLSLLAFVRRRFSIS
ncbi:PEP-CTERM domain protein [Maridesulfovibrio zosterae]|uniref:PEP-CTERM domain protein n=1 Tax=Maridesulfovibrio zosterae TaxID=82171 RepID=UPI0003FDD828|nr:PEP-CTERM domain protein [Maridesulfovibrio zosterae]